MGRDAQERRAHLDGAGAGTGARVEAAGGAAVGGVEAEAGAGGGGAASFDAALHVAGVVRAVAC